MHKYNKYLVAGLLLSLLSFSTYAAAEEYSNSSADTVSEYDSNDGEFSATVTEHDNDFCITNSKGEWEKVTFSKITKNDTDSYSVTKGQPFSGINPGAQPSKKTCIRVRSGRSSSDSVIAWVYNRLPYHPYPVIANASRNFVDLQSRRINDANFAFTGTLKLTDKKGEVFSCPNVIIGQSSSIRTWSNVWFMYNHNNNTYFDNKSYSTVVVLSCTNAQGSEVFVNIASTSSNNTFQATLSK